MKSEGKAMWLKGVRAEMWKDNERSWGGGWIKKKKRKTKIIEDISQAEAGLLRRTMLIEE